MKSRSIKALSICLAAGGISSAAMGQTLYDNGSLLTTPTGACIPAGSGSSALQAGNTLLGANQTTGTFRMADNFVVPAGQSWTVNGITFLGYQTGAGAVTPSITGATLRIWYAPPNAGGAIVAGDATTNVLSGASAFSLSYRHGACDVTRAIWRQTTSILGGSVVLQPGTYWADWSATGSASFSGPWCPTITANGLASAPGTNGTTNGLQFTGTAWATVFGATTINPQDLPFTVQGTVGAASATGRCCFTDGSCDVTTSANCALVTGTIFTPGGNCTGSPCVIPNGACCLPSGGCQFITNADCTTAGGTWSLGTPCASAGCADGGACCFYLANSCQQLTQAICDARAGSFTSVGTSCAAANCPLPPSSGDIYAVQISAASRPILSFPINAPAFNTVVPGITPLIQTFAVDFDNSGNLWVITNAAVGAQALGKVDVTSGAFTQVGLIAGAGAAEANWAGLSFDASTNTMYALAGANLYTVNLTNGNTTLVAPITGLAGGLLIDFAVNRTGNLMIGHDIGADKMFVIDKATGVATGLPQVTGFAANFAQGMDFDPLSGNLFAAVYTGTPNTGIVKVNTTTGACQLIANTSTWAPPNGPELEIAIKGCYGNCDGSTSTPRLTANDFQCFINEFAAGHSYANCDGSTSLPALTANDFQCFIDRYAEGCP